MRQLYSQLGSLYGTTNESDGAVTQGMREVYAGLAKELRALEAEWAACRVDLERINRAVTEAGVANIIVPAPESAGKE